MEKIEFRAMGSQMMAALDTEQPEARDYLAQVPGWFETWEQSLSRFRQESELSLLNRSSGYPVQVSTALWEVLQLALRSARWAGGLVTPTMLPALEAVGYDRNFDDLKASGEVSTLVIPAEVQTIEDWETIEVDARTRTVRLPRGMRIDLGGVAKGWAADQAVRLLSRYGPALVDAGGDVAVSGPMANGDGWPVGVTDPITQEGELELVMLKSGGVATSGRDYRRWKQGGVWQHHILDPRTGHPAETDVLSVTVVGPETSKAEAATKAALILGSAGGLEWIESHPELAGLLVLEDGRVLRSSRLPEHVWS